MDESVIKEKLLKSWNINDIIRDENNNIEQIYLEDPDLRYYSLFNMST